MTREEEIRQVAHKFALAYNPTRGNDFYQRRDMLENMAKWADEHQKNPWRDMKKDPPERELGNKICYTFLDTASDGVHEQRFYHFAEYKKYGFGEKGWLDEDGNHVLVEIADYWMPLPELSKGGEK